MGKLKSISNIFKYGFYLIVFGLMFSSGFMTGRKTMKIPVPETKIEYRDSKPVHDTLWMPSKPRRVVAPVDTADIIKQCIADGIYKELWPKEKEYITKEDTAAVMKDWATKRYYSEKIFDSDSLGKLKIDAEVQYNRMKFTGYEFIPKVKTIEHTIYTVKKWSPFVEAGVMFGPWNEHYDRMGEIGGGVFYKDKFGAELKYQRGFVSKNDFIGGSVLYKF